MTSTLCPTVRTPYGCQSGLFSALRARLLGPVGQYAVSLLLTLFCSDAFLVPERARAVAGDEAVIHREESLYQFLIILENKAKNERYMANLEKTTLYQGGIMLNAPDRLLFEYTRMSFVGLAYLDEMPKEALFVGLGIGAMPRFLHALSPNTAIEVAEIDPAVVKLAKEYFTFKEDGRMRVTVEDGRQFVKKKSDRGYDIIFLDAYQGDTIPFHLTTQEFLREVKKRLHKDGVVVSNILSPGRNKFFTAMIRTYQAEFANLALYKGKESKNYVFVASDRRVPPEAVRDKAKEIQEDYQLGVDLVAIIQGQGVAAETDVKTEILTDDFAPVNLYRHMEEGQP